MTLAFCVDDCGGVAFNNRRQSRDRYLIEDLVKRSEGKTLCILPYSQPLFENCPCENMVVNQEPPEAWEDCLFFAENCDVTTLIPFADVVILYRWNRTYPGDVFVDVDFASEGFILSESFDFRGYSHDLISGEVWKGETQ